MEYRGSGTDRKLIEESPLSEAAVLWAVLGNKGGGGGGVPHCPI